MAVRYHDGTQWTEFVCLAARTIVSPIERIPLPPDIADDDGETPSDASTPTHGSSLIRYVAVAFIGVCFLFISDAVSRDSAIFEWTNRMGMVLLLTLTVSYAIIDVWALLTGKRSGASWVDRWVPVLISIIIPVVLLLKAWGRVLEALWLK